MELLAPQTLLTLAVALAIVLTSLRRSPSFQRRSLRRFGRRVDLPPPPPEAVPRIEAALTRRGLTVDLVACAGLALVAGFGWVFDLPAALAGTTEAARGMLWALLVAATTLAGSSAGAAWAGARHVASTRDTVGPRVARPVAATAADYVAPIERWGARVMPLAPALGLGIGLVIAVFVDTVAPSELINAGTVTATLVGPVALVAAETITRRLLDLPQIAGSAEELAWNDAVRAQLLRDVITAPLAIGVYASWAMLAAASGGVSDPVIANGLIGLIGLGFVALFVIAIAAHASRPERHFRQRLWSHVPSSAGADDR